MKIQTVIRCQRGLTLVELMISIALGLMIIAIMATLMLSARSSYVMQDESIELQETARVVLEIISRAVRQAGYQSWDKENTSVFPPQLLSPDISGLDAKSLKATTVALDSPIKSTSNDSDVLAVRFFGSGAGIEGDGTMLNCAGFSVAAPSISDPEVTRGWSIFYIAVDSTGEPELRCKYKGKTGWSSEAIARGIESFQVLYGLDSDGDGLPNQYLTATELNALDDEMVSGTAHKGENKSEVYAKSYWKKIVMIKVGMLVRGSHNARTEVIGKSYALFGGKYCEISAAADKGACIKEQQIPVKAQGRLRKVYEATIQVRNQSAG